MAKRIKMPKLFTPSAGRRAADVALFKEAGPAPEKLFVQKLLARSKEPVKYEGKPKIQPEPPPRYVERDWNTKNERNPVAALLERFRDPPAIVRYKAKDGQTRARLDRGSKVNEYDPVRQVSQSVFTNEYIGPGDTRNLKVIPEARFLDDFLRRDDVPYGAKTQLLTAMMQMPSFANLRMMDLARYFPGTESVLRWSIRNNNTKVAPLPSPLRQFGAGREAASVPVGGVDLSPHKKAGEAFWMNQAKSREGAGFNPQFAQTAAAKGYGKAMNDGLARSARDFDGDVEAVESTAFHEGEGARQAGKWKKDADREHEQAYNPAARFAASRRPVAPKSKPLEKASLADLDTTGRNRKALLERMGGVKQAPPPPKLSDRDIIISQLQGKARDQWAGRKQVSGDPRAAELLRLLDINKQRGLTGANVKPNYRGFDPITGEVSEGTETEELLQLLGLI
ncbi:MAG: hypothetical protein ACK5U7_07545 [Bacteroidota bacterium]|jgi:hypothetical protein